MGILLAESLNGMCIIYLLSPCAVLFNRCKNLSLNGDLFCQCIQLVLESPRDGRRYVFELNDRLIRDKELDGLTEIPVKPDADSNEADGQPPVAQEPSRLPGLSMKMIHFYIVKN